MLLKARIVAHQEKKRLREQETFYLQQIERLTTAAAEVEAKTFNPESLADLVDRGDKLGQLARGFQRMVDGVQAREQRLTQQVQLLQAAVEEAEKKHLVNQFVDSDHFRQPLRRTTVALDPEIEQ
jgi:DNA repair ATPase RecN